MYRDSITGQPCGEKVRQVVVLFFPVLISINQLQLLAGITDGNENLPYYRQCYTNAA
jgi:hypothetical protein